MPHVIDLTKNTDAYMTSLRTQWQEAKADYAATLEAKKITFSKGLGHMLDRRLALYKPIHAYRPGNSLLIIKGQLNSLKANGKAIKEAATAYQARIKGLGGPAEQELRTILDTIIKDAGQYDIDYVAYKLSGAE